MGHVNIGKTIKSGIFTGETSTQATTSHKFQALQLSLQCIAV